MATAKCSLPLFRACWAGELGVRLEREGMGKGVVRGEAGERGAGSHVHETWASVGGGPPARHNLWLSRRLRKSSAGQRSVAWVEGSWPL